MLISIRPTYSASIIYLEFPMNHYGNRFIGRLRAYGTIFTKLFSICEYCRHATNKCSNIKFIGISQRISYQMVRIELDDLNNKTRSMPKINNTRIIEPEAYECLHAILFRLVSLNANNNATLNRYRPISFPINLHRWFLAVCTSASVNSVNMNQILHQKLAFSDWIHGDSNKFDSTVVCQHPCVFRCWCIQSIYDILWSRWECIKICMHASTANFNQHCSCKSNWLPSHCIGCESVFVCHWNWQVCKRINCVILKWVSLCVHKHLRFITGRLRIVNDFRHVSTQRDTVQK